MVSSNPRWIVSNRFITLRKWEMNLINLHKFMYIVVSTWGVKPYFLHCWLHSTREYLGEENSKYCVMEQQWSLRTAQKHLAQAKQTLKLTDGNSLPIVVWQTNHLVVIYQFSVGRAPSGGPPTYSGSRVPRSFILFLSLGILYGSHWRAVNPGLFTGLVTESRVISLVGRLHDWSQRHKNYSLTPI